MDFLQGNVSSKNNGGFGLHSKFLNKKNVGKNFNMKNQKNNEAYYAKKGEPMYVKEMDEDEDGVVSLDEFKAYCEENGISSEDMLKMLELAHAFRSMQTQKGTVKRSDEKSGEEDENVYARKGDSKYDAEMDTNSDDKVSYEEYLKYCEENLQAQEEYIKTIVKENEDGSLNIMSPEKAVNAYTKTDEELTQKFVDDLG